MNRIIQLITCLLIAASIVLNIMAARNRKETRLIRERTQKTLQAMKPERIEMNYRYAPTNAQFDIIVTTEPKDILSVLP